jgi:hypothetical protein
MSCLIRRKSNSAALLLCLGVVLGAATKDFWETKPFTEWNEQEVMKMLSESPWARTLNVFGGTLAAAQAANRVTDLPTLSTTGAGRGSGFGLPGTGYGTGGDSVPLYVNWFSSSKIRQAFGRLALLRNEAPEAEIKKYLAEPRQDYEIAISGPLMDPFNSLTLSDFKSKTSLSSKKDKSKTIPLKNYVQPKDRKDGMAIFFFERQISGKPAFNPDDQEVEFSAQGKKIILKASFKLSKMMDAGNLDL